MPWVTEEQIARAREVDLLTYLQAKEPNELLPPRSGEYRTVSHASLQYRNGWQWNGHRLSLGGTSPVALIAFLERNPQITRVILHLDNDIAGLTAARKIKAQLTEESRRLCVSINPPRGGKDYNDALQREVRIERKPSLSRS